MRLKPGDLGKERNKKGQVTRVGRYRAFNPIGKIGATAGWVVGAADNVHVVGRLPQSQTSSTLVVPINGLRAGSRIQGGFLSGQIESAGGTATITWALRKQTAAAADPTDALVEDMAAALSVTADTALGVSNTAIPAIDEEVVAGVTYYVLITGTTAGSTDEQVLAVNLLILEEPAALAPTE
jgi:hypothetical protein